MKKFFLNAATAGFVAVLGLTLLTGCFRKHIKSSPPPGATPATRVGPTPAASAETAPAPAPTPVTENKTPGVIEETYVVDAPEQAAPAAKPVEEADLDAEPGPAKAEAAPAADAAGGKVEAEVSADPAVDDAAMETEKAETAPAHMGELYYVQVGAFSELENANKVLAGLMEQGYDGSKLVMTDDGRFRVQAGAFTDKESAREALDRLMQDYSGAFILKGTPE